MKAGTETQTFSGMLSVVAACRDCDWTSPARNAMGTGAQHAHRTGHRVRVVQQTLVVYAPASMGREDALEVPDREVCRG